MGRARGRFDVQVIKYSKGPKTVPRLWHTCRDRERHDEKQSANRDGQGPDDRLEAFRMSK